MAIPASTGAGVGGPSIFSMARRRTSFMHASQVFTDTQKVDLFNDPRWEASSVPERGAQSRLAMMVPGVRSLVKKGRHSRTVA